MGILARGRWLEILAFMCALLFLQQPVYAGEGQPLQLYEQKIKAGLVYNFLKYTVWPREGDIGGEKLVVCLFGGDPFDGYLSPLEGRTAQQYLIQLVRVAQVSETAKCSAVIIGAGEEGAIPQLLGFLRDRHVLTVSDAGNFAREGGMVEIAKEGEKINLYVNENAVTRAGLGIEERMLRLAKIVSG